MYPDTPTHTEELLQIIGAESPDIGKVIKEYIDNHDTTQMQKGVDYYFNRSDITKRVIYTYENDVKVPDDDATNNKLPIAKHKQLVDQKVAYLSGNPPTLTSIIEADDNLEHIYNTLGDEFEDTVPELIKHSSNKGREWLHPYIDEEGNFDYIIVSAMEFIPIYDNTKRKNLIGGIRYYDLDDGTRKIELWDKDYVWFYEEIDGEVVIDVSVEDNPQSHFYYMQNGERKGYGWGEVPFIEFRNNEEAVSDLTFYKALIDAYELIISDTTNTIVDVQSVIYALKGYEGTSLEEFVTNLKRYKVISVSDEPGSGVDTVQAEIPTNAVDSQLKRMAELIIEAGQGVDFSTDKFGNSPSGVALKFLYTSLDMKCSILERKFKKGLKQFLWFICEYLNISENLGLDYTNYSFTFNRTVITNEAEDIVSINKSKGLVSDETLRERHPYVEDVQLENERIAKQESEYMRNMPDIEDVETGKKSSELEGGDDEETCPECGGIGIVISEVTKRQVMCMVCRGDGIVAKKEEG